MPQAYLDVLKVKKNLNHQERTGRKVVDLKKIIKRICPICKKIFFVSHRTIRRKRGKFCSIICLYKRLNLRIGLKNPLWKGDKASYVAKHIWVSKYKGKPKICSDCGTTKAKKYHWANISGHYKRNLKDYKRLCVECHKKFDGHLGEGLKVTKLNNKDILKIRNYYLTGEWTHKTLANEFNVTHSAIWSILSRRTWKHI